MNCFILQIPIFLCGFVVHAIHSSFNTQVLFKLHFTTFLMVEKIFNEGIFVVHALKGYEYHEARIKELFKVNGLNFEFVTDGDPSNFTNELIGKYFVPNIQNIIPSKGTISCTLNHIYAYEKIAARNIEYAIVFENDPFFLGDFKKHITKMFSEIERLPKGFIISLENTTLKFPSFWQTKKGKYLYRAKRGRMAGAYIVDLEGAKRLVEDLKSNKCNAVIDWWHNNVIVRGVVKMYWSYPSIVEQGSHNGFMSSTISSKSKSALRRISWLFQKYYKTIFKRLFNEKRIIKEA